MNDLFWSLYLIDVVNDVPSCALLGFFIGAVSGALYGLWRGAAHKAMPMDDEGEYVCTKRQEQESAAVGLRAGMKIFALVFSAVTIIGSLAPSKDTMYMMLAVRMTDNVMQSDTGQKLMNVLRKKLDAYINEIDPPKKEK